MDAGGTYLIISIVSPTGLPKLEMEERTRMSNAPKPAKRLVEFRAIDRARAVAIKVAENTLPVLDVLPQAGELHVGLVGVCCT